MKPSTLFAVRFLGSDSRGQILFAQRLRLAGTMAEVGIGHIGRQADARIGERRTLGVLAGLCCFLTGVRRRRGQFPRRFLDRPDSVLAFPVESDAERSLLAPASTEGEALARACAT